MRSAPLYLLDTNVVSVLGMLKPNPDVINWIEAAPPRSPAIAWSTVYELQYGIENARNAGSHRTVAYERALGELLDDRRFRVLRPTTEAAGMRARMHATPALRSFFVQQPGSRRQSTGEDLTIAATAIAAGAVVVTSNVKDFSAIDRYFPLPGLLDPVADRRVGLGVPAATMRAGRQIVIGKLFPSKDPPIAKAPPLSFSRMDIVRARLRLTSPFTSASEDVTSSAQPPANSSDDSNLLQDVKESATRFRHTQPSLAKGSPNRSNRSLHELSDRRSEPGPVDGEPRRELHGDGQSRPRPPRTALKGVPGIGGRRMTERTRSASSQTPLSATGLADRSLPASISN